MFALLPPSSSVTGTSRCAAASATARPVAVPPVRAILLTSGCVTSASPVSRRPGTTFSAPSGKPTSVASRATSTIEADVTSDGLTTTVFPAASAGPAAIIVRKTGEFQGVITAITPSGSRSV